MGTLKSFLQNSFNGMGIRANEAVIGNPAWLDGFRAESAMLRSGQSLAAADVFASGVDAGWPPEDVQAYFLTACVTIEKNVKKLRAAGIFSEGTQVSTQSVIDQMLTQARDIVKEQKDAVARLKSGVDSASMDNRYADFVAVARGNLTAIAKYVDQTIEARVGIGDYGKRVADASPEPGPG